MSHISRRAFLKTSAAVTAAFVLPQFGIGRSNSQKLNIACIGLGNAGLAALMESIGHANIVAISEVHDARVFQACHLASASGFLNFKSVPRFLDYRDMFAQMGDRIDAVTICAPDHHHYLAAMLAIQRGIHVYVESPLSRTVGEARALREAAAKYGVISQMGNRKRSFPNIQAVKRWTRAGHLGEVREILLWSPSRAEQFLPRTGPASTKGSKVPKGLVWDLWLGPAPARPYSHLYGPENWRGWWDFGSGMLGNWGGHALDAPFWALDLNAPEVVEVEKGPLWSIVTYQFAARDTMPSLTIKWCDGDGVKPPPPLAWDRDQDMPDSGVLISGSDGSIILGDCATGSEIIAIGRWKEKVENYSMQMESKIQADPVREWIDAIQYGGAKPGLNFDYAGPLTEVALLGAMAMRTGKRIEWDSGSCRITNDPSLNQLIETSARPGWKISG